MKTPQEIFESELDIEAKRIFCALPEEEKRRIVAVRFPPTLKDADEDIAVLNATIYNGIIKGRLYADAEEVETFGLVDVVTSRGWVRYKDVYASPRRIEPWKRIEAQEEADARDLAIGRNFGANKPPHIEEAEAVAIMKRKGGHMTDRTLRTWIKLGKAGRVKYPIVWDDLASTASWSAWVDAYLAAETARLTRKSFISSRAGKTQAEKSRRRSPTA